MVLYPQSDWGDIWYRLQIEPKRIKMNMKNLY